MFLFLGSFTPAFCDEPATAQKETRLTTDSLFKRDPVFVNGGKELVYVLLERPEQLRLMRMKMADGHVEAIHKDERRSELEPAFSRDGRYYAYLQSRSPASVAMVIRDTLEDTMAELKPAAGFSGMRSPDIAPDNSRLIYAFPEMGAQQIFSIDMKAGDRRQLTQSRGINNWPGFSFEGSKIVFSSTRDGNFEIYVMNANGSDVRRLTEHRAQDIRPKFSPDGKQIVFVSNRDGNFEIYRINIDGSSLTRITHHPERDDFPNWHPDGKQIVTVSERAGRFDLYLHRVP